MQLRCTALPLPRARRSLCDPRKERWSLKLTRHNGRAGKHGTYNPKHNDRSFEIANSEHIEHAAKNEFNIVILDTAGRLHIDDDMMAELQEIKENVTVHQTVLVVDAMTGQDAVNVAKMFDEKVGMEISV